ncbi:MAG: Na+/H+ antiporter NhaC family protein [Sumerlaeia bacterium]
MTTESAEQPRRAATLAEAFLPLAAVAILLPVGYGVLGLNVEVLLIAAAVIAGLVGLRLGYTYREMQDGINETLHKSMTALLIVIVVGALIAAWIACGTIPMLIYYGLKIIAPQFLLVTACIVCSLVSLMTGTSWGTVGTVGLALMGIAHGMGYPLAPAAGAIIAGAYFGDKLSLFSDTTNLAPAAAKTNIYDHVGHMIWTTAPAYVVGLVIYLFLGLGHAGNGASDQVRELSEGLAATFRITGLWAIPLAIPPVITLGAAVMKKPVIPSMLLSCVVAWVLAVAIQGDAPIARPYVTADRVEFANAQTYGALFGEGEIAAVRDKLQLDSWTLFHPLWAMVKGYEIKTGTASVDALLSRGGMISMMDTFLLALTAFAFAGILSVTGMLKTILDALLKLASTTGRLVLSTALSCMTIALCTGSSYLSILLPGELFAPAYRERGLAAKNLSRTTEDCGTVIVPLIPWSVAGAYMSGILGVPVLSYAPFAFMCYLGAVFAVLYGFTGFKIAPRVKDDETQTGS